MNGMAYSCGMMFCKFQIKKTSPYAELCSRGTVSQTMMKWRFHELFTILYVMHENGQMKFLKS